MDDSQKKPPVQLVFSVISEGDVADRYALGLMTEEELDAHVREEQAQAIRHRASAWKRNHKFTHETREQFLDELSKTGNVSLAAFRAGVSREAAYHLRDRDEEFKQQMDDARDAAADVLEMEAFRRAVKGVEKPIYYQGVRCGVATEYSDSLLKTLLVAARPMKFSDRMIQANAEVSPDDIDALLEKEIRKAAGVETKKDGDS